MVAPDVNGNDFIDRDTDSFHVRVYDPNAVPNQPITVQITTTHPNAIRGAGYQDNATNVTLLPLNIPGLPGWFISDSQLLVSNEVDDSYTQAAAANPNWVWGGAGTAGGIRTDNASPDGNSVNSKRIGGRTFHFPVGDRTHVVALGGQVRATYGNLQPAVSDVNVKKVVKLHVNNMKHKAGNTAPRRWTWQ